MNVLIVGASGATGKLLVARLLDLGHQVNAIVRSPDRLPKHLRDNEQLVLTSANLLDLSEHELAEEVKGCDAVASCLGHNISFKGIYGQPRRLVTNATRQLCLAIKAHKPSRPIRYVLMNTAGNRNRNLNEPLPLGHSVVIGLLRLLLPPHVDNEKAADFLRIGIGQNDNAIEWAAVRPDALIDEESATEYDAYPSPIRSAIFNPGKTSRINVAHFMADLITNDDLWNHWKGQMPVIYNRNMNAANQ